MASAFETLDAILAELPSRERAVLHRRWWEADSWPQARVARELGITVERVAQLEASALARLRARCRELGLRFADFAAELAPPAAPAPPLEHGMSRGGSLRHWIQEGKE